MLFRLPLLIALALIAAIYRAPLPYPAPPAVEVPPERRLLPATLAGVFEPNAALLQSKQLFRGVRMPETPIILDNGTAYIASAATGELLRSSIQNPDKLEHVAWVGGNPLGMAMHPGGYIVVCDSAKGLLSVDPATGAVGLLTTRLPNASLAPADADVTFCDDVAVSQRDGKVYFSDATRIPPLRKRGDGGEWDALGGSLLSLFQGAPTGRLLVFDPAHRSTKVLAEAIWFANGVALSEDESYVLVVESLGCRVMRHWLGGPRAGTTEVFLEGLPGFPDGISRAPGGATFWLSIISTLSPIANVLPHSRPLRWLLAWLPDALKPKPTHYGLVAEVSADGHVLRTLHDPSGARCHTITSATQVGSTLYMGSLGTSHVCALDVASSSS